MTCVEGRAGVCRSIILEANRGSSPAGGGWGMATNWRPAWSVVGDPAVVSCISVKAVTVAETTYGKAGLCCFVFGHQGFRGVHLGRKSWSWTRTWDKAWGRDRYSFLKPTPSDLTSKGSTAFRTATRRVPRPQSVSWKETLCIRITASGPCNPKGLELSHDAKWLQSSFERPKVLTDLTLFKSLKSFLRLRAVLIKSKL